jgi:hypothetical protein
VRKYFQSRDPKNQYDTPLLLVHFDEQRGVPQSKQNKTSKDITTDTPLASKFRKKQRGFFKSLIF